MTALAMITNKLLTNYSNNKISTVIQTDLSSAFDTVDHKILLNKLDHYGIRGKCLNIIKSFLSDRRQYVSIDSIESNIQPSLQCSVIQGSKLSALLYTLYINEVPRIHELLNSNIYNLITGENNNINNNIVEHLTIQYVDDSNNIITTNSSDDIEAYINKYFKLVENFYNINKLKINPDKSKLMIVCKPTYRSSTNSIVLQTSQVVIEQVQKVKALGMYISSGLTNHANVSNIISKVNFRLSVLREVFKYAEYRTKIILMNSLVVSIFRYSCPLLIDSNAIIINKLQTLLMKCARQILGFKSYKMNTVNIMKEVKMLTVHHLIIKESIGFIHKIIFNENPKCIFKLLEYNSQDSGNIRKVRKMRVNENIIYKWFIYKVFWYS